MLVEHLVEFNRRANSLVTLAGATEGNGDATLQPCWSYAAPVPAPAPAATAAAEVCQDAVFTR